MQAPIVEPSEEQHQQILVAAANMVVALIQILGGMPNGLHTISYTFQIVSKEPLGIQIDNLEVTPPRDPKEVN